MSTQEKYRLSIKPLTKSKARRVFRLFKPKEIIEDEDYEIGVILTNIGTQTFPGGSVKANVKYMGFSASIGGLIHDLKPKRISHINPNESKNIILGTLPAIIPGTARLQNVKIRLNNGRLVTCYDKLGYELRREFGFAFSITSKNEIRRRYESRIVIIVSLITLFFVILNYFKIDLLQLIRSLLGIPS